MQIPDWLTSQSIAHRGLHNKNAGIVENSASAFEAAIAAGYAIETDLQCAGDGMPMVFHDEKLERLTRGKGDITGFSAAELKNIEFRDTGERMMDLKEFTRFIGDRTPLLIEIKSRWQENAQFPARIAQIMKEYDGRFALMSFDPRIMAGIRRHLPGALRGLVTDSFNKEHWPELDAMTRFKLRYLYYAHSVRPDFIAHNVNDLASLTPRLFRKFYGPVLTWTVRSDENMAQAGKYADNVIFEKSDIIPAKAGIQTWLSAR